MQAREHVLAGAGLAEQKHTGIARRDAIDRPVQLADRLRVADQPGAFGCGLDAVAQKAVLVLEPVAQLADLDVLLLQRP